MFENSLNSTGLSRAASEPRSAVRSDEDATPKGQGPDSDSDDEFHRDGTRRRSLPATRKKEEKWWHVSDDALQEYIEKRQVRQRRGVSVLEHLVRTGEHRLALPFPAYPVGAPIRTHHLKRYDTMPCRHTGKRHIAALDDRWEIYVRIGHHRFRVDVCAETTVEELKVLIQDATGVPVELQRFFFKHTAILSDEATLPHYGIGHGCELDLRPRQHSEEHLGLRPTQRPLQMCTTGNKVLRAMRHDSFDPEATAHLRGDHEAVHVDPKWVGMTAGGNVHLLSPEYPCITPFHEQLVDMKDFNKAGTYGVDCGQGRPWDGMSRVREIIHKRPYELHRRKDAKAHVGRLEGVCRVIANQEVPVKSIFSSWKDVGFEQRQVRGHKFYKAGGLFKPIPGVY